jgi:hypothetical protein
MICFIPLARPHEKRAFRVANFCVVASRRIPRMYTVARESWSYGAYSVVIPSFFRRTLSQQFVDFIVDLLMDFLPSVLLLQTKLSQADHFAFHFS